MEENNTHLSIIVNGKKGQLLIKFLTDNKQLARQLQAQYKGKLKNNYMAIDNPQYSGFAYRCALTGKVTEDTLINELIVPITEFAQSEYDAELTADNQFQTPLNVDDIYETFANAGKIAPTYHALNRTFNKTYLPSVLEAFINETEPGEIKTVKIGDKELTLQHPSSDKMRRLIVGYDPGKNGLVGSPLTGTNPLLAVMQDPEATYVATQKDWENYFNRSVEPNAPIIWIKSNYGTQDKSLSNKIYNKSYDDLSASQKQGANKNLGISKAKPGFMHLAPMFDVRYTKVIDGMEDVFNTEPCLASNIYGELNKAAKAKEKREKSMSDSDLDMTDDALYQRVQAGKINEYHNQLKSNICNFLKKNQAEYLADNNADLKTLIERLVIYQLIRSRKVNGAAVIDDTQLNDVVAKNPEVKKMAFLAKDFLEHYFNLKINSEKTKGVQLDSKADYVNLFYIVQQSAKVMLGRYFGLPTVTTEAIDNSTETNQQIPITNMELPTFKDVIEYFDIDYKSLQDNVVSDKMQFEEKINKDISLIKETFYKTYKKLLK